MESANCSEESKALRGYTVVQNFIQAAGEVPLLTVLETCCVFGDGTPCD